VRWCAGALVRLSDKKSMSDICLLLPQKEEKRQKVIVRLGEWALE